MSTSVEGCCFERQSVILPDTEVPAFWQAVVLTTAAIACLDKLTSRWSKVQDREKYAAAIGAVYDEHVLDDYNC